MDTPLVPMSSWPAPATVLQMAAPPEEHHAVFVLRGFLNRLLDEAYTANTENMIGGRPIYSSSNGSHFIYFQRSELRWVISPRYNGDGITDLLAHVLRGEMRGIAFEGGGNIWQEFFNGSWHPVTIQFSKLVAEKPVGVKLGYGSSSTTGSSRTYNMERNKRPQSAAAVQQSASSNQAPKDGVSIVICEGFFTQALNTTFEVDRKLAVGGRSTYWDAQRKYFLYYQSSLKRWAISCRDAGGEDLLLDAQRGGTRGLAYEVDKDKGGTKWSEYFRDSWQIIEPRIQKLNAASELSLVAPASQVRVPQTRPPQTVVPQAQPKEPIVAIKIEDATPSIPDRNHQEPDTPVPTQPLASVAMDRFQPASEGISKLGQSSSASSLGQPLGIATPHEEGECKEAPPKDDPHTEELPIDKSSLDESSETNQMKKQTTNNKAPDENSEAEKMKKQDKKEKVSSDESSEAKKAKKQEKKEKMSSDESSEAKKTKKQAKKDKKHKKDKKEKKLKEKKELEERLRRELMKEMQDKMKRKGGRFGKRNIGKRRKEDGEHPKGDDERPKERKSSRKSGSRDVATPPTQRKAAKEVSASLEAIATAKATRKGKQRSVRSEPSHRDRKCWPKEITDSWPRSEIKVP
mmetsp:Transcript_66829/g.104451  ORF Transcript_66829/g.104451 Transcript_66829/m.104451 type:complete len:630 (-) Transcript_66829:213-2102(-)